MQTDGQKNHAKREVYDWASYYEASLYQLKRENVETMLAIEASRSQEEILKNNLLFIKNNPLWKILKPLRVVCDAVDRANSPAGACCHKQQEADYKKLVFGLKHPYGQWIDQIEKSRLQKYSESKGEKPCIFHYVSFLQCGGKGLQEHLRQVLAEYDDGRAERSDQYVVFVSECGCMRREAEAVMRYWFAEHPDALMAYADEDHIADAQPGEAWRMHPWFKPGWSPETMLSFFYFGSMVVMRADLLQKLRAGEDRSGNVNLYDLVLQAAEHCAEEQILHIPEVLFHNTFTDYSEEELARASCNRNWDTLQRLETVLQQRLENGLGIWGCDSAFSGIKAAAFERRGIKAYLEPGMDPAVFHVVYDMAPEEPLVSAVILSKDHPDTLETCLVSLTDRTDYSHLEIIVVDNGSSSENRQHIEELKNKFGFNYIYKEMDFNFSAQCNMGVREAKGDVILLINDDIEVIEQGWLRRMAGQAVQPDIGAVGARLLYAGSNKIQHAGITNLGVGPSHKLIMCPDDAIYDHGRNRITYNMLGVTAACLVVEKRKYEEVGGLCEAMRVAYNDVDFCFSLYEKGYRNVLRNDALLYHYESLSRGSDVLDDEKWLRFLDEKRTLYERHPALLEYDPYYHRDLADDSAYYICNFKCDADHKDKYASITRINAGKLANAKKGMIRLEVDHAGLVPRDHARNLDDYWVSGWSFLPGADQYQFEKRLLFQNEKREIYEGMYFIKYRKDVEEMFSGEKNISGAGFSLRFVKGTLKSGCYRVGILYRDPESGKQYVTWSDKRLVVE